MPIFLRFIKLGPAWIEPLLEAGAEIPSTALVRAALARRVDSARLLLERGADPRSGEPRFVTPMGAALMRGDEAMIAFLR